MIKKLLFWFYCIVRFLKYEVKNGKGKLTDRFRLIISGFYSESKLIYNFNKYPKKLYVSDWERLYNFSRLNEKFNYALDNKIIFERFFSSYFNIPKSLGIILKGKIYSLKDGQSVDVHQLLKKENKVIIKPIFGGGGKNIFLLEIIEQKIFLNNAVIDEQQVKKFQNSLDNYIIQKYILQNGFAHEFYPNTLNTLRILTSLSYKTNERVKIVSSVFRIGSRKSNGVDNWSSGGISVSINLATGELGSGVIFENRSKLIWVDKHPDTFKKIKGTFIPGWSSISKAIIDTAKKLPYIPYIGWDIIPMQDTFIVLEVNSNSDVNLLQVHSPLKEKM